jgi:phage shock protein PspC (stress-responsive transcriptional regulator)
MKTTTTINLAQRLITIDTDAYLNLQQYLSALKNYFASQDSGIEIYNDIESRISEIMADKLKNGNASIAQTDLDEIINKVGTLQDLGIEEPIANNTNNSNTNNANSTKNNDGPFTNMQGKRLMRNENDKLISGLCSGVATYLNIDPIWVRAIFVLIGFGGGFGIVLYIIGSIVVPKSYDAVYSNKRLYRSLDDKFLGGVCGGLAQYFHTSVLNIRLIFLSPILIGLISNATHSDFLKFGGVSLGGFFPLVYLLLWILVPQARTSDQKLQARGEAFNVNNLRAEAMGTGVKFNNQPTSAGSVLLTILKVFLFITIGLPLIATFVGLLIAFVAVLFSFFAAGTSIAPYTDYLFRAGNQHFFATAGWILFLALPLVVIVALVVRRLVGIKTSPKYLIQSGLLGWGFGLLCIIFLGRSIIKDTSHTVSKNNIDSVSNSFNGDSLIVDVEKINGNIIKYDWIDNDVVTLYSDGALVKFENIKVQESADANYHFSVNTTARGNSQTDAQQRLNKIQFVPHFENNKLIVPNGIMVPKGEVWRFQQVDCIVYVPKNKKVLFTNNLDNEIEGFVMYNNNGRNFNMSTHKNWDAETWYTIAGGELKSLGKTNKAEVANDLENEIENAKLDLENLNEEALDEAEKGLDQAKDAIIDLKTDGLQGKDSIINGAQQIVNMAQQKVDELRKKLNEKKTDNIKNAEQKIKDAEAKLQQLKSSKDSTK